MLKSKNIFLKNFKKHDFNFMIEKNTRRVNGDQGGRSCTGARVAPAEKFGLGRKF